LEAAQKQAREYRTDPAYDAAALLRWARTSESSGLAVLRPDGYALRYPLFNELDTASRGGLQRLSGPHTEQRYPGLSELVLQEGQAMLASGRRRLFARYERTDGLGVIELRLERLRRRGGDVAIAIAHSTGARPAGRDEPRRRGEVLREARVQAMGMVASGVAHDLNHALNVIALRLARLRQDPALSSARHHIESLERVADEAAATVARLQDLARRRRDAPSASMDLSPVIEAAVEAARSEMEEAYRLDPDKDPTLASHASVRIEAELSRLPTVGGSATEVGHIFLDLLLNARDAMPKGGTVRVTARVEGEQVLVSVEDEGPGVLEQNLMRVFDPFFTMSATRDTGLGLSIAAGVMERIGGSISVSNRLNSGTVFTLGFPLARDERRLSAPAEARPSARALRVLLVDDEADNLEVLAEVLAADGHEVSCAASGRAALELLRSSSSFDLLLCDVGMPGMSGWQLVREAKQLEPTLRIYMLTGWANEIAEDDPRARLVRGVLGKPIDLENLRWLLAQIAAETGAGPPEAPAPDRDAPQAAQVSPATSAPV
jgi:signal transduction histidine kinase/ActR/RegA family two-component response regulator